ncbi:MAG: autotransporter-associated beta strand repeat-containing protein, partial [Akkermansiaceae bacterium]|nr:autotransporter-associated beta strand repeat-containing protein [Akkermansiaceae bacterium]
SNLVVNAGTLEMNGKSETINGLSGGGGVIQNLLADTSSTLTLGDADASATFGGTLRDNFDTNAILALTKTGAGTQVMGNATHNGPTLIATGTLHINGAISASPLTVKGGARLNIGAELPNLESLALEDGAGFQARLDTTEPGNVFVAGDLDFSGGTVTLYPVLSGVPELQTYLFAEAGAINGTATLVADFSANGLSRLAGTAAIVGNTIQLTITQAVADLVWNNAASNGLWNVNDARNFRNGFLNDFFLNGDRVLFDTVSPPGAGAISLQGTLAPSAVEVNSADDFTFAGDGSLTGAMTLIKRGTGTLAIDNTNTFTGPTTVEEGILTVDGTLGTGKVDILPLAILRGTGTVPGAVFIDASAGDAATVAPGAVAGAVGALATGPMTVYGTYRCDIDGAQADRIDITGNLSLSETSAALDVNFVSPSTAVNHPIITYTGTRAGTFDPLTIPAGWEIDYSDSGKVVLWPAATTPPAGMITFEADQGYPDTTDPEADRNIAGVNGSSNDAPFDGTQGWSRSTSTTGGGAGAAIHPTNSSGEYRGGQAIGANNNNSYIGGKLGGIEVTGANTLTFDAPFNSGTQVGFFSDADKDGLFDQSEAGMSWGFQGATIALGYRDAGFGTVYGNFPGTAGHWYRFTITIGGSTGSSRDIVMAVRNLTTGADYDFDAETAGIQPLAHTVTDAQFGVAPERADGIWVRTTSSARIDNLRATSVEPPAGTAYDLWMDGFPELTGDARLPGSDPDNDGTKNLLEFVLNGDPRVSDTDILPQPELMPNGDLKLTFSRRDDSEGLVTLTLQTGTTLDAWDDIVIGAGDGSSGDVSWTVVENGTDPDLITLTLAGNGPKKFARLKAMEVTTP